MGIMCINCGKTIGFTLYNCPIEDFITVFVTNIVFQHVGLSWIIYFFNKFNFEHHFLSWILNGPLYDTTLFSQFHGSFFQYCVTAIIKYTYI